MSPNPTPECNFHLKCMTAISRWVCQNPLTWILTSITLGTTSGQSLLDRRLSDFMYHLLPHYATIDLLRDGVLLPQINITFARFYRSRNHFGEVTVNGSTYTERNFVLSSTCVHQKYQQIFTAGRHVSPFPSRTALSVLSGSNLSLSTLPAVADNLCCLNNTDLHPKSTTFNDMSDRSKIAIHGSDKLGGNTS
ncbi:hypothetical protein AB1N83_000015 [Pleurotus pulmonarius]